MLLNLFTKSNKPKTKHLDILGEGANGVVYVLDEEKIMKNSKHKHLEDVNVLKDINHLHAFPSLYDFGADWYIAERFIGEEFSKDLLKKDWKEVFLKSIEQAFVIGWEVEDLKTDNFIIVDGYVKMFDVGMFRRSTPSEKDNCLYWTNELLKHFEKED